MADMPKLELSRFEIPEEWTRRTSELASRAQDLAADLAAKGSDLAGHWTGRVKSEARSFAKREEGRIDALTTLLTSPTAQLIGAATLGFVIGVAANSARKAAIQGSEAIGGDWLAVLKAEHRMAEALFEALLKTSVRQKNRRTALFIKLKWALMKHALQEETVIYPGLRETHVDGMAKHLYADHADIKIYLSELDGLPKDDPLWIERVRALQACVAHHVREEETEVFPHFHGQLSPQQNRRLTALMHKEGLKLA
jgi:hemerythrin superfamily protein